MVALSSNRTAVATVPTSVTVPAGGTSATFTVSTGSLTACTPSGVTISAAYALFATVLMPFLVFVAPRITQSLHPQTVINPQGKILMDTPTRVVFFGGLVGFSAVFLWMLSLETRAARLRRRPATGAAG